MLFRRVLAAAQLKRPKSSIVGAANPVLPYEDIPSPKGLPIIGTTLNLIAQGGAAQLHKYIDNRHKELGPIFKERLGPVSCLFISDPDEIRAVYEQEGKYPIHLTPEAWITYNELYGCRRGLFFMNGFEWWHYRRILNGLMLKGDLKWIENACDCGSDMFMKKVYNSNNDYFVDLEGALYKLSLDIVVAVLLGPETYTQHRETLEVQVAELARIVHLVFETTAKLSLIKSSWASKLKLPRWNRFVSAVDDALEQTNSLIDTLMLVLKSNNEGLLSKLLNEKIDLQDIRRIIADLILAAGDTTAVSLEWMLYLIAKNKEVQEQLRRDSILMKYVIKETLRLYPIATFLTRILPEDSMLGGYGVPKGTLVIMSLFTSGRDERFFKDPNSFNPERWDRKDANYNRDMHKASIPFAIGRRTCIGKKISESAFEKTLLKVVKSFRVELGNKNEVDVIMKMVAHPSEPLKLRFNKL